MPINCENCSKCCDNINLPIPKVSEDIKRWIELHYLKIVEIDGIDYVKIDNKCCKLIAGECSIYETRPDVCRQYDCNKKEYKNFKNI